MREILFRGKRKDNGEWGYGDLIHNDNGFNDQVFIANLIIGENEDKHQFDDDEILLGWSPYNVIPSTIGQYTGLTDKNGRKIFEGDIVRYGDTIHKVVFEQRSGTAYFGLVYSPFETLPFGHYQDLKQIEIIGNIYDNPELLKGGNKND